MISAYTRPQVCERLLVRRDAELGRYHASNLMSAMWVERFLQSHVPDHLEVYEDIKTKYLNCNPFA